MKVVAIIPTRNEAVGIAQIVTKTAPHVDDVLVVDGNSTDGTREAAASAGARVILDDGRGKGSALRMAARETDADILLFIDADGSHDPEDIPKLLKPLLQNEADLVVASRIRGGSDEMFGRFHNFIRASGVAVVTLVINVRWGKELTDVENGYRAIRRDVFEKLGLRAVDFDIEQEMVMKAVKKKYRVMEVASHEYSRQWGESKLPTFKKSLLFIWRLVVDLF